MTPFEHTVKRCISTYQRMRSQHADLRAVTAEPPGFCWFAAFDNTGNFIGVVRSDSNPSIVVSATSVKIGNREWH
jgi:hypothetical protein